MPTNVFFIIPNIFSTVYPLYLSFEPITFFAKFERLSTNFKPIFLDSKHFQKNKINKVVTFEKEGAAYRKLGQAQKFIICESFDRQKRTFNIFSLFIDRYF